MFCPTCGRAIPDSSRYCPYCNEYVKNAPREDRRKPLATEAFHRREERIEAMRRSNRRRKRLYGFLIFLIVLVLAVVVGFAVMQKYRETHPVPEITTEEKRTTEPLTAPSTRTPAVSRDTDALASFDENRARLSAQLGETAGALSLGDAVPAEEGYGAFAYYDDEENGLIYLLTDQKSEEDARLREVCGPIDLILPARTNYTYQELKNLLGDSLEKDGTEALYADGDTVVCFTASFGGADALLDGFRLYTEDSVALPAATTEDPSQKAEQAIREDPEGYFAGETKTTGTVATEGGRLNIRSFAGTDYSIVSTIENGAEVTVYGSYNGWSYIETEGGEKGWVLDDYLKAPAAESEPAARQPDAE